MKKNIVQFALYIIGLFLCGLGLFFFYRQPIIALLLVGGFIVCLVDGFIALLVFVKKAIAHAVKRCKRRWIR